MIRREGTHAFEVLRQQALALAKRLQAGDCLSFDDTDGLGEAGFEVLYRELGRMGLELLETGDGYRVEALKK